LASVSQTVVCGPLGVRETQTGSAGDYCFLVELGGMCKLLYTVTSKKSSHKKIIIVTCQRQQ